MPSLSDRLRHLLVRKQSSQVYPGCFCPADGSPLQFKTLDTVETDIAAFTTPPTNYHMGKVIDARLAHMIYHFEESACQPDINFLPDTKRHGNHGHWDDEAWSRRCVTGNPKFHLLFTRSTSGLTPNPHVDDHLSGDMFILKVSDTDKVDKCLKNFYVDMKSGDLWHGAVKDLLWGHAITF